MVETAFGRVKIGKEDILYFVRYDGIERIYKRVKSTPCRTSPNCDEKLINLLSDPNMLKSFKEGIEIIVKRQ